MRYYPPVRVGLAALLLALLPTLVTNAEPMVDFSREVRPILSDRCFECHGPDAAVRQAGLRLDMEEDVFSPLGSDRIPVVPGDPDRSEMIRRIIAEDPAHQMPPADFHKQLTQEEKDLIVRWVEQGAQWDEHWSFVPPQAVDPPEVSQPLWVRNPIDNFVLSRLDEEGLEPSPQADKRTLIRRVTLDLTGLPPTPEEVEAFVNDNSSDAFEKVVDRLLATEQYGEHMARFWLDLARYADTNGYHIDNERFMWRWRDWVIDAFNRNQPFDEFTIEQLAGDLLPEPELDQLIATGFNRNHMITFEGGIIEEEYRTQYVMDRVNTLGTVWLGMTMSCAQCHDHKYDPISHKDYFSMYAFFNSVPEKGSDGRFGNAAPLMKAPLPEQQEQLAAYDTRMAALREQLEAPIPEADEAQAVWEEEQRELLEARWVTLEPKELSAEEGVTLEALEDGSVLVTGENPEKQVFEFVAQTDARGITAIRLEALTDASLPHEGTARSENGNFVLSGFEAEIVPLDNPEAARTVNFHAANADHSQNNFEVSKALDGDPNTGWSVDGGTRRERRTAVFIPSERLGFPAGTEFRIKLRHESEKHAQHALGRFRLSVTTDSAMAPARLGPWYVSGPFMSDYGETAYKTVYPPEEGVDLDAVYEDGRAQWVRATPQFEDGAINDLYGEIAATYLYRTITAPTAREMTLSLGSNDAIKVWLNGEVVLDNNVQRGAEPDQEILPVRLQEGENTLLMKIVNYGAAYAFYFRNKQEQVGAVPLEIESLLAAEQRGSEEERRLREFYRAKNVPEWRATRDELAGVEQERTAFEEAVPTVMVMDELKEPRDTFILLRGEYDQPGEQVQRAVPEALPPMPEGAPMDRLGLAQWLLAEENPLTARVVVNRYWARYFGTGLVKTVDDFGVQGEQPSHPELLDWLALEFMRSGWDVKAMQRMIVTSAAYQQSSKWRPELLERDPENRLMAKGPRHRLDAEVIRDNALAVSGLLVPEIGGPSVNPYQPGDLWKEVSYGGTEFSAQQFEQDEGDALYRRSMYTFWKRQAPPASMLLFDAPNREVCSAQRARTNTPLQALQQLNDTQFVEAARHLAERMLTEIDADMQARVEYGFALATARTPSPEEIGVLLEVLEANLASYSNGRQEEAKLLLAVGDSPREEGLDPAEHAAWTTIASMILNLDEVLNKS